MLSSGECGAVRVLLAGDDASARDRVRAMQAIVPDIVLVAEANSTELAVSLAARLRPQVIVLAFTVFADDRAATIRQLTAASQASRILVMSARPDDVECLLLALSLGVASVVSVHATHEELLSAIRAVANDQIVLRRSAVAALTARQAPPPDPEPVMSVPLRPLARLTDRERSVFQLIAEGYNAPEIGGQLSISKKTVETYKKRIGEKLGFWHRADYVRVALYAGVLLPANHSQLEREVSVTHAMAESTSVKTFNSRPTRSSNV